MRWALLLAPAALLAGCAMGPNYRQPDVALSHTARFARADTTAESDTAPMVSRWWDTFGDPILSRLEDRALARSPRLAEALARVRQSRASLREQRAAGLPSANATALYAHAKIPGLNLQDGQGDDLDVYNLGFDASWEVDLFGGRHRALEAARATAAASQARLADSRVSLTADVAAAYVNLRDRQQRILIDTQRAERADRMLALIRQRAERGTASRADVETLTRTIARERGDAAQTEAERDVYLDALAILTGDPPGAVDAELTPVGTTPVAVPQPPSHLVIGNPAMLLMRRPDVRAAERTLAAQTAKIGQAKAARLPRLSFMGLVGIGGTEPGNLFDLHDITTLAAPQLSWKALDFGRGLAQVHEAEGARDEAEAAYRTAVLAAAGDAEDSLARLRGQRRAVGTAADMLASATASADLAAQRYRGGTATLIDKLTAERDQLSAEGTFGDARAQLGLDFISLQKALGLGWSEDAPPPVPAHGSAVAGSVQ